MEPLVDWMGFGLEGEGCCTIQASEDVFSRLVLIAIQIHLTFSSTRGAKKTYAHTQMGKQYSSVQFSAPPIPRLLSRGSVWQVGAASSSCRGTL